MFKKIIRIAAIVLFFLIVILFTAPFIFRGKIIRLVKAEINNNLLAKADFEDVDISFFRRFPKVAITLDNLYIAGVGQFKNDTLLSASKIDASADFWSVVKGENIQVHTIKIIGPNIHAIIAKDGAANWDIMKPDTITSNEETKPFRLELKEYSISNGALWYNDSTSSIQASVTGLDHSGTGDFNANVFTLRTSTTADSVNFLFGSIPYLVDAKTNIIADIIVDNTIDKYSFNNADILLNQLKIKANGFFQLMTDSTYSMDIAFSAPSTDFKNILSLIPVIYSKDFAKVQTRGQAIFNGFVKGLYTPTTIPAYQLNLDVANGFFKYPDLPTPLEDIRLKVKVDNPDGVTDHTQIDIADGHLTIDKEPFDFKVVVKNPVSDLFIDGSAKGSLDLSKISKLVKLESGTQLKGLMNADVTLQGKVSAIEKQQYEQFNAAGFINLTDFLFASKEYPDGIRLHTTALRFNPKNVTVSECKGRYLKTNFAANGIINNLLSYILRGSILDGALNIKADHVNLDDWMGTSSDTTVSSESQPFIVPSNIRMVVNTQIDHLLYDKLTMEQLTGALQLEDQTLKLNNVKGKALDGTLTVSGSYSTRESKQKPAITLKYDVKNLDVQKTFLAFNTVQRLMPIGQYLSGRLNSQLSMTGRLGDNMMPDFKTLTGNGSLLLIEGLLDKFKPLEKLAEVLNVKELRSISLKEVKEFFEFTDGRVLVKPFDFTIKNIQMEVGGMHGFDQSLDYVINLKLPRSLMGDKGNQLVNNLMTKAANRGVPLKVSEIVNLNVRMTGTIRDPSIKVELREMAGSLAEDIKNQAKDFAKAKIDSTKQAVKDTILAVKKQVVKEAGNKLKEKLFGTRDSTLVRDSTAPEPKKRAENAGKDIIEGLFKKRKKPTDTLKRPEN